MYKGVVLVINELRQEVKFTDLSRRDTLKKEHRSGELHILKGSIGK